MRATGWAPATGFAGVGDAFVRRMPAVAGQRRRGRPGRSEAVRSAVERTRSGPGRDAGDVAHAAGPRGAPS